MGGLYRRQTEAARAELLASEWGQRAVQSALIQDVALAHFNLRAIDAQMAVTESTIQARKESLQLTQALEEHGAGSLADVRQAEELLHTAQANLPELRRQTAITENFLSILLDRNPRSIDRLPMGTLQDQSQSQSSTQAAFEPTTTYRRLRNRKR